MLQTVRVTPPRIECFMQGIPHDPLAGNKAKPLSSGLQNINPFKPGCYEHLYLGQSDSF